MNVVVDRRTWLRGEGAWDSSLLRKSDNKMCCLGFACEQAGVPRERLMDVSYPNNEDTFNGVDVEPLATVNDDPDINDTEREATLIKDGAALDIHFTFIN